MKVYTNSCLILETRTFDFFFIQTYYFICSLTINVDHNYDDCNSLFNYWAMLSNNNHQYCHVHKWIFILVEKEWIHLSWWRKADSHCICKEHKTAWGPVLLFSLSWSGDIYPLFAKIIILNEHIDFYHINFISLQFGCKSYIVLYVNSDAILLEDPGYTGHEVNYFLPYLRKRQEEGTVAEK